MTDAEGPESLSENERLRRQLHEVAETLKATTAAYEEFAGRRVVRVAARLADALAPLYRRMRSQPEPERDDPNAAVWSTIAGLDRQQVSSAAPRVSVVITTRDHHEMLVELLDALDRCPYPDLEIVVVDNGSSDATADLDGSVRLKPTTVVHRSSNASFSAANNLGVAASSGELVLVLNDDILPLHTQWLSHLVEEIEADPGLDAVGAVLVHPVVGNDAHVAPMQIQHFGIGFAWDEGFVRPFNKRDGDEITIDDIGGTPVAVVAATAACLLVRRQAFDAIGGFDEHYVYGYEDVDLCLRLPGRVALSRRAVLVHRESTSQNEWPRDLLRVNRLGNRRRLMQVHGRALRRQAALERLMPESTWRARPPTVGITVMSTDPADGYGDLHTGTELAEAMERAGWRSRLLQAKGAEWADVSGCDVVISLLQGWDPRVAPDGTTTVAWVRNVPDRWIDSGHLDHFDLVLSSSVLLSDELERACGVRPFIVPLATNPERFSPTETSPTFDCDIVLTANHWGVERTPVHRLERRPGERMLILGRGWESVPAAADISRGPVDYTLLPMAYSSASIALDETTVGRLEYGAVNSRVFDALGVGTLVLSNNVVGSQECFDGLLPTYETVEELRERLDHYLANDEEREALASGLRQLVLGRHTYDHRAAEIEAALAGLVSSPSMAILIGAPRWEVVQAWGDYHFAVALARALRRRGVVSDIRVLPEWGAPATVAHDIVLHLRGITPYVPVEGAFNVLWLISHPELLDASECDRFDLVLVASEREAQRLGSLTSTPVHPMLQASALAPPVGDGLPGPELVFVGNTRGVDRHGVRWAGEAGLPLAIYGAGWSGPLAGSVVAEQVENHELAALYHGAGMVLNDHWPDMAERGFISNRIFDACAAGAVCLTDPVAGLDEAFGDAVLVYRSAEELQDHVERLCADPLERLRRGRAGREIVARNHTFEHRADELVGLLPHTLVGMLPGADPGRR